MNNTNDGESSTTNQTTAELDFYIEPNLKIELEDDGKQFFDQDIDKLQEFFPFQQRYSEQNYLTLYWTFSFRVKNQGLVDIEEAVLVIEMPTHKKTDEQILKWIETTDDRHKLRCSGPLERFKWRKSQAEFGYSPGKIEYVSFFVTLYGFKSKWSK